MLWTKELCIILCLHVVFFLPSYLTSFTIMKQKNPTNDNEQVCGGRRHNAKLFVLTATTTKPSKGWSLIRRQWWHNCTNQHQTTRDSQCRETHQRCCMLYPWWALIENLWESNHESPSAPPQRWWKWWQESGGLAAGHGAYGKHNIIAITVPSPVTHSLPLVFFLRTVFAHRWVETKRSVPLQERLQHCWLWNSPFLTIAFFCTTVWEDSSWIWQPWIMHDGLDPMELCLGSVVPYPCPWHSTWRWISRSRPKVQQSMHGRSCAYSRSDNDFHKCNYKCRHLTGKWWWYVPPKYDMRERL